MRRRELPLIRRTLPQAQAERSVKKTALALLQIVDHFERKEIGRRPANRIEVADAGAYDRSAIRSVGLSYTEVMRRLREEFPAATTSIACLRWYCVHVRQGAYGDSIVLPQRRPRQRAN
jgi:hypothetical protein